MVEYFLILNFFHSVIFFLLFAVQARLLETRAARDRVEDKDSCGKFILHADANGEFFFVVNFFRNLNFI